MLPVHPHPDGRNDRTVIFSASPGLAPSMYTGPVTGLTRARSSFARSAAVDVCESCPDEASTVSKCTVSPGAIFNRGANALFQPWWTCARWIVCWSCALTTDLLDSHGESAVDHQVRARDATGDRAREEQHAVRNLCRSSEPPGRIDLERRVVEVRHVLLDRLPDAA